jgi:hypothetical protein
VGLRTLLFKRFHNYCGLIGGFTVPANAPV